MSERMKEARFWWQKQEYREIEVGQRFRRTGLNRFYHPHPAWEVVEVTRGSDGLLTAQLQSLDDPAERKQIGVEALRDSRLYELCSGDDPAPVSTKREFPVGAGHVGSRRSRLRLLSRLSRLLP